MELGKAAANVHCGSGSRGGPVPETGRLRHINEARGRDERRRKGARVDPAPDQRGALLAAVKLPSTSETFRSASRSWWCYVQAQLALVGRDDDLVTLVHAHGAGDVAQPEGNCDESLDVTRGVREPVLGDGDRQRWSYRGARGRRRSGGDPAALLRAEPLLFAPRLDAGRLRHLPLAPAGDPRREPPAQGDHLRRFSVGEER